LPRTPSWFKEAKVLLRGGKGWKRGEERATKGRGETAPYANS